MSKTIGQRIRELRELRGLTQTELAKLLGCGQNTVAEWERSTYRGPNKQLLRKVAQTLEVSIDYLLGQGKIENSRIACYGEVLSEEFVWPIRQEPIDYIDVPPTEHNPNRFSFRLLDDLLEPIAYKGDYCIFEKLPLEDGNIALVRFAGNGKKAVIRKWRQQGKTVMLAEINPHKSYPPYFVEVVQSDRKRVVYLIQGHSSLQLIIEGKLVAVKRVPKAIPMCIGIKYIFS